jgi:peptidyl-prolyl cis-trans isomerase C
MHKFTQIAAALLIGASMSLTAVAADKKPAAAVNKQAVATAPADKAFVKVNGVPVSQNLADAFIAEQKAKGAPDTPDLHNAVREELIRRELLLQEAKQAGIDKNPSIAAQAEAAKQAVLIRNYVQQFVDKHPISDDQLQANYDKIKAQVGGTEYKTQHILVKEESEAKAIIEELKNGAKFDELAQRSIDPGSKDKGGDLGWAAPGNYVKPFADALVALEKGKYTETPVQSQFGYHVIQLEDTRPATFPAFEEIKPRLLQQIQTQEITKMVDELRAKAKVE